MRKAQMLFTLGVFILIFQFGLSRPAHGQSLQTLATFNGGTDGTAPFGGLVFDTKGNLYGTTYEGEFGTNNGCDFVGCGTVFQISPTDVVTDLHQFIGPSSGGKGADGAYPYYGSLVIDPSGNLYGTTYQGGADGCGTIFRVAASGKETVLYSFTGKADGCNPYGGLLIHGPALYGTAFAGGVGDGTVFKLSVSGFKVLHAFEGGSDGASPWSPPVADAQGNLYGTASAGGINGFGLVYKISLGGAYSVIYAFKGGTDGAQPRGTLIIDPSGNLYGTTYGGGSSVGSGYGTIFKITSSGVETVLADLVDAGGFFSDAGLARDSSGNLYGTTLDPGVVFKLDTSNVLIPLSSVSKLGYLCITAPVILDKAGNLYGTANDCNPELSGIAFKLIP